MDLGQSLAESDRQGCKENMGKEKTLKKKRKKKEKERTQQYVNCTENGSNATTLKLNR